MEDCSNTTAALEQTDDSLDDPERREDSEDESRDVNETCEGLTSGITRGGSISRLTTRTLMVPDTPQAPSDGQTSSEITFRAREGVCSAGTFEEEEREEDEELGPELSRVSRRVDTESLKGSQPDEDNGPSVVERERKVDKN